MYFEVRKMKTITKIIIGISILFLLIGVVSAALNSELQAPDEFEHSEFWDKNNFMDIYSLKGDNNTRLYIEKYDEENDAILFENDKELDYSVTPLDDNMYMAIDNGVHEGSVMEVIEFNGEQYFIYTALSDNPSDSQVKDSSKYLTEFNKLNNVEPINI